MGKEVTTAAVINRINRKLKPEMRRVRKIRGEQAISTFGEYALWDDRGNHPIDTDIDVEKLARDLGVLARAEVVSAQ